VQRSKISLEDAIDHFFTSSEIIKLLRDYRDIRAGNGPHTSPFYQLVTHLEEAGFGNQSRNLAESLVIDYVFNRYI
jgi:hypothetical protein